MMKNKLAIEFETVNRNDRRLHKRSGFKWRKWSNQVNWYYQSH